MLAQRAGRQRFLPQCRAAGGVGFGKGRVPKSLADQSQPIAEPCSPDELYAVGAKVRLSPWAGPVKVAREQQGRAVLTTRSVQMGQLLMVARPAALLTTPPTSAAAQPSLDQLHSALQQPGQAQEASRRALQVLYDGSEASSQRLLKPQALASCQYVSAVEPQEGSDASSRLHQALKLNAFGESLPDAAAWVARGQVKAMRSYVGVWPGQAMYNHSCSPNASAMPLLQGAAAGTAAEAAGSSAGTALFQQHDVPQGSGGDAGPGPGSEMLMLVRAARNMKAGDEVTIAYTDRILTVPLDVRQSHLESNFGFKCACGRCKVEQQQPSTTRDQLTELYDEVQALEEPVLEAIVVEDWRLLQELQQELLDVQDRAREVLSSIADDHVRLYLHAWVYDCYMLLGLCTKAFEQQQSTAGSRAAAGRQRARRGLGGARRTGRGVSEVDAAASAQLGLDALHTQQQLLQAISPGSSELAALSARRLAKLQELQGYNDTTQEALEACVDAHVARYGRIGAETLARLVDAREHRELGRLLPVARASQQAAQSAGSA